MQSKRTLELLSRKYVDMHCTCIYTYVCVCVCVCVCRFCSGHNTCSYRCQYNRIFGGINMGVNQYNRVFGAPHIDPICLVSAESGATRITFQILYLRNVCTYSPACILHPGRISLKRVQIQSGEFQEGAIQGPPPLK